jgi:hypothetical protein
MWYRISHIECTNLPKMNQSKNPKEFAAEIEPSYSAEELLDHQTSLANAAQPQPACPDGQVRNPKTGECEPRASGGGSTPDRNLDDR